MRTFAICGTDIAAMNPSNSSITTTQVAGVDVVAGVMSIPDPEFSPETEHRHAALIGVHAFSCNYRDTALILRASAHLPADRFYSIGSEFVGTVLAVGDDVTTIQVGQRVIPNGSYPGEQGSSNGLPTNHGSREIQVIDAGKLVAIPDAIDDAAAASLTIGAQTTYGMVRRLAVDASSTVLVTAGRSNTSLFAIQALRATGCTVAATTTSTAGVDMLTGLGADQVFVVDPDAPTFADDVDLREYATSIRGFDAVIDPFFDVHLHKVVPVMGFNARYITCGLADQFSDMGGSVHHVDAAPLAAVMLPAMMANLEFLGNCLGTTNDLERGIADCAAGVLNPQIDSVHEGDHVAEFLDRTYSATDRCGKVVYRYATM